MLRLFLFSIFLFSLALYLGFLIGEHEAFVRSQLNSVQLRAVD